MDALQATAGTKATFCRTCGFHHEPGDCPRWPATDTTTGLGYGACQLDPEDQADLDRIRRNHADYRRAITSSAGQHGEFFPHWAGILEVNVEELLEIIARLTGEGR